MDLDRQYALNDPRQLISPALLLFRDQLQANLDEMLRIAGSPQRLRPHCKTHKIREVAAMQVARGITRHKCATFPEAEMLVAAGASDVLLAYPLVGPNLRRAVDFRRAYPHVEFSVIADDEESITRLGSEMQQVGQTLGVWLDIDTGQRRTGVTVGERARKLYARIADSGLRACGLHVYDGQNHQTDLAERRSAVRALYHEIAQFRDTLQAAGHEVPRIVAGGSGSFPCFAEIDDPALELSPGTLIFFDAGYRQMFPDLGFQPAALLLTRVISRPTANRITLDLGYKACAADPPAGRRLVFPQLPHAREVLHNEEHLVLETDEASDLRPGDTLLAIPWHICPTTALHKQVHVVRGGAVHETWEVAARDRMLSL